MRIEKQNLSYTEASAVHTAELVKRDMSLALGNIEEQAYWVSSTVAEDEITAPFLRNLEDICTFDGIRFVTSDGMSLASNGRMVYAGDREYFIKGIKGESGISVVYDSRLNDGVIMSFYAPVLKNGKVIGVLNGIYDTHSRLSSVLQTSYFGVEADVFLCDRDGRLLSTSYAREQEFSLEDELLRKNLADKEVLEEIENIFKSSTNGSFVCSKSLATDSVCAIHLAESNLVIVQTFPKSVTQSMVVQAAKAGVILEVVLLVLFVGYLLMYSVYTAWKTHKLRVANQDMSLVISGITTLFSRFVVVDLHRGTYKYLAGTAPAENKIGPSGHYSDLIDYLCGMLEDSSVRAEMTNSLLPLYVQSSMVDGVPMVSYEYRFKSGWTHISIIELKRKDGLVTECLLVRQDVSALKEFEQAAHAELQHMYSKESAYRKAIMSQSVCTFDFSLTTDTIRSDIIREAGELTYSVLDKVGLSVPCSATELFLRWADCISVDDRTHFLKVVDPDHLRECFERGETEISLDYWATSPTGRNICVRHSIIMTLDPSSCEILVFVVTRDITEQVHKQHEQMQALRDAVQKAERASQSKTAFLANMSHDIRTPMNAVLGFTQMALKHVTDSERVTDCLKKTLLSGEHLLGLIDDILDMSRIESGKLQINPAMVALPDLLHELLDVVFPQIKSKQLQLYTSAYGIHDEVIHTDPLRLKQALINLLSNAVKYTPSGGTIWFSITQCPCGTMGRARFIMEVRDNGIGMSSDFVEHIFEPFERESTVTKTGIQGAGLGMSITKNVVDALGGTISVDSTPGEGSTFCIELEVSVVGTPISLSNRYAGKRVLLCGEDVDSQASLVDILSSAGVTVKQEARTLLACLNSLPDVSDVDVVIIDCALDYQKGMLLGRALKDKVPGLPCILVTPYDQTEIEDSSLGVFDNICRKPVFPSNMVEALQAVWDGVCTGTESVETNIDFKGCRILLVEDNELNREIAYELLTDMGFNVDCAPDGTDAVRMVAESTEGYYAACLMDVQMPTMGGYEATQRIRMLQRKDVADLPILAMTANALEEDREAAFKHGMNAHLAKPIDMKAFVSCLQKFVKK